MSDSKYYYKVDKDGVIISVSSGVNIRGFSYYSEEKEFCSHCGKPITVKDITISEEQLVNEVGRDENGNFDTRYMTPLYILSKHHSCVDIYCEECWKDFIKCEVCGGMYHKSGANDMVLNGKHYTVCGGCVRRLFNPYGDEED